MNPIIKSFDTFPVSCKMCGEKIGIFIFKGNKIFKKSEETRSNILCNKCSTKLALIPDSVDPKKVMSAKKHTNLALHCKNLLHAIKENNHTMYSNDDIEKLEHDYYNAKTNIEKWEWLEDAIISFDLIKIPNDIIDFYEKSI